MQAREEQLTAAQEDHSRRIALRKQGDQSWCADPTSAWLLAMFLAGTGKMFGEEAQEEAAEKILRAWPSALEKADALMADFARAPNPGAYAFDFCSWFFEKQHAKRERPGYSRPGWGLLFHDGVLDEYKNAFRSKRRSHPRVA